MYLVAAGHTIDGRRALACARIHVVVTTIGILWVAAGNERHRVARRVLPVDEPSGFGCSFRLRSGSLCLGGGLCRFSGVGGVLRALRALLSAGRRLHREFVLLGRVVVVLLRGRKFRVNLSPVFTGRVDHDYPTDHENDSNKGTSRDRKLAALRTLSLLELGLDHLCIGHERSLNPATHIH
jgi:hypothetical protein